MPTPAKLDLIPTELRVWLAEELKARGFAEIVDVTEALNFRLEEEGMELTVGKTAVGKFSKSLKMQREAFAFAEVLLSDLDIQAEGELHKVLLQMIATSAVQYMRTAQEADEDIDPKDLMNLGRMLKDLMHSSGLREKLLDDERKRVAEEARREALTAVSEKFEEVAGESGLSAEAIAKMRNEFLGVKS